jgi:hypothetical protein
MPYFACENLAKIALGWAFMGFPSVRALGLVPVFSSHVRNLASYVSTAALFLVFSVSRYNARLR